MNRKKHCNISITSTFSNFIISLNILVHDVINLLCNDYYYVRNTEHTNERFYVYFDHANKSMQVSMDGPNVYLKILDLIVDENQGLIQGSSSYANEIIFPSYEMLMG